MKRIATYLTLILLSLLAVPQAYAWRHISPYAYCAGDPVNNVDTDGESIYMLFYTSGNSNNGDETFLAAAETRKQNIEHSSNFNSEKDIVIMQSLQDMAMMSSFVEQIISDYSSQYGRTIELGVWSHSGYDGPVGTVPSSAYQLDEAQITMEGWSKIDFNWEDNACATFYGCNSARLPPGGGKVSFADRVSRLNNFKNVDVSGQLSESYPSTERTTRSLGYFAKMGIKGPSVPTYMIGWTKGSGFQQGKSAFKMNHFMNGICIGQTYQKK